MAGKERPNQIVHRLINEERKRRGLSWVRWSNEMYRLAKDQSNKMARAGRLFHSDRFALQGGENICGGKGHHSPRDFVTSWMRSPRHRAWILDPRVKTAGVGISSSRHGTYAAWAFSDQPLHQPIKIKPLRFKMPFIWAKVFTWAFGLILTGVAVSQLRQITSQFISTTLVVLFCLFATSAVITLYFEIRDK